ncbi:MAG: CsiV family protein [Gammaproteobacteria bacterium]
MYKFTFALFLSLLTLSSVARAEDVHYYDVETIIFESLNPTARTSEKWKSDIIRKKPPVSVELDQPYPGQMPPQYDPKLTFKTLPADQYQLNSEEKRLVDSKQYRILLHTAWVQPGMGPKEALPVHITRTFLTDTPVTHSLIPATPDASPANLPAQTDDVQTHSVLDGYIKIILTRYLHAEVDLTYTTGLPLTPATGNTTVNQTGEQASGTVASTNSPVSPASAGMAPSSAVNTENMQTTTAGTTDSTTATPGLPPPVIYQLHQSRRMRSKVLHYLDHPVLGMLLIITPHASK